MCTLGLAWLGLAWLGRMRFGSRCTNRRTSATEHTPSSVSRTRLFNASLRRRVLCWPKLTRPRKQWGPRVTSVERATPNRSALNAATSVASSPHRMPNRNACVQECWSSRAAWARDGWRVRAQSDVGQLGAAAEHERLERGARRRHRAHAGVADVPAALERELPVFTARFRDCRTAVPQVTRYDSHYRNR